VAFTPYAALTAPLPVAVAVATRQWWAAAVAGVALAGLVAAVAPRAIPSPDGGTGPVLRVLTANLMHGECDPDALVSLVRDHAVDLLALQEYTLRADGKLRAAGLGELLPYRSAEPRPRGNGSALYSRYPLDAQECRINAGGHRNARASVEVPGAAALHAESVHPASLYHPHKLPAWHAGLAGLPAAGPDGPVRLLLGDFNATLDHARLRALLRTGYRDAASVAGRGLVPTWPYRNYGPIPRVTLDHVLADRRVRVRAVAVYPIPGSDHRAVFAELILPTPG